MRGKLGGESKRSLVRQRAAARSGRACSDGRKVRSIGKKLGRSFTVIAQEGRTWSAQCSCGLTETREKRRLDRFCRAGCPQCDPQHKPPRKDKRTERVGIGWTDSKETIDQLRSNSLSNLARMALTDDIALVTLINKVLNP